MIFARKIFFPNFVGKVPPTPAPSPTPMAPYYAERSTAIIASRLSSVCLSICDVEISWSYSLREYFENNYTRIVRLGSSLDIINQNHYDKPSQFSARLNYGNSPTS